MTAPSLDPERGPRDVLSAPQSASTSECGAREGRGAQRSSEGPSRTSCGSEAAPTDFDSCHRACRTKGVHTLIWGGCEHAAEPEPTVSISVVYTDHDGHPSIGFDQYTAAELAAVIEPGLRASDIPVHADYLGDLARTAAEAIIHRHDKEQQ